jgi:hypothetical protein
MESLGGRKFVLTLFGAVLIFIAFAFFKLDGLAFTGGLVALGGLYVEGNVRTAKIFEGGKKK